MLRKDEKLVERDENVPGYRSNNAVDRKIVQTMIIAAVIVLLLLGLAIGLYFYLVS